MRMRHFLTPSVVALTVGCVVINGGPPENPGSAPRDLATTSLDFAGADLTLAPPDLAVPASDLAVSLDLAPLRDLVVPPGGTPYHVDPAASAVSNGYPALTANFGGSYRIAWGPPDVDGWSATVQTTARITSTNGTVDGPHFARYESSSSILTYFDVTIDDDRAAIYVNVTPATAIAFTSGGEAAMAQLPAWFISP
jgi:hypothetical protein